LDVEYEVNRYDAVAASTRMLLERSVTARRQTRKSQIESAAVNTALVLGFSFLIGGTHGLLVGAPIAAGLVAMIWVLIPRSHSYQRRRFCIDYYRSSDGISELGPRRLQISDAGITVTSPEKETLYRWPAVTGVVVANDRLLIDLAGGELVVPLRDFSEQTRQELLLNVARYLDNRETCLEPGQ
jgi:hypothetical protein